MGLRPPNLDSRTFQQLVDEARARIPRYTPDWTNLNDSDPGMTLVKLQAWLTETLLYELNRLPELNYIKFLELLNVQPRPASAAHAELSFRLKKLSAPTDPLLVLVPKGAQVAVDDPDLEQEVVFETDYTLRALNAVVAALITVQRDPSSAQTLRLVTEYDAKPAELKVLHAFHPFTETPATGDVCLIGILPRPHRRSGADYSQDVFPTGQLDLAVVASEVFDRDEQGAVIAGPLAERCRLPSEVAAGARQLVWEVYVGTDHASDFADTTGNQARWKTVHAADETAGLQDSGHVRLELGDEPSAVSLQGLPRSLWVELGLKRPPSTAAELLADLADSELGFAPDSLDEDAWRAMGVPEAELAALMSCCTDLAGLVAELQGLIDAGLALDPSGVSVADWQALEVGYDAPAVPGEALVWLRARVTALPLPASLINTFLLNTVPATAAVTRLEEVLGNSDGRPGHDFRLARAPIYVDPASGEPELTLEVVESGESRPWTRVNDFFRQGPDSEVFLLDPITGDLTFGDGVHGRIPVAGAQVVARRYRYGGGAVGNAGPGSVSKLKTVLPSVDGVSNARAASGGGDAEALEETKLRAAHELRARDRAVTAEDFASLARATPGVAIQRAYALARRRVGADQVLEEVDGAVTVVVLPISDHSTPQPSEAELRAVCAHLDARRLLTTELYVTGPRYLAVTELAAEIRAAPEADLKALGEAAYEVLLGYLHPLRGGEDGTGWPFGGDLYLGNLYQRLLSVAGANRVLDLSVSLEGGPASGAACSDALPVPEGHLLHLAPEVIDLRIGYDDAR